MLPVTGRTLTRLHLLKVPPLPNVAKLETKPLIHVLWGALKIQIIAPSLRYSVTVVENRLRHMERESTKSMKVTKDLLMLQYATKKGQPELEKRGDVCCEYVSGAWS
jgi:hypothetical protein